MCNRRCESLKTIDLQIYTHFSNYNSYSRKTGTFKKETLHFYTFR